MGEFDTTTVRAQFKELPEQLKDMVVDVESADNIAGIAHQYQLTPEQHLELGRETGYALMGLVPLTRVPQRLAAKLGVDSARAHALYQEVRRACFAPVQPFLDDLPINSQVHTPTTTTPQPQPTRPLQPSPSLIRQKLEQATTLPKEDPFTLPRSTARTPPPPSAPTYGNDPYHEPIE